MPESEGGQTQHVHVPAATLVRSDQESGMALVKSKDGRIKWLTVSTDPASTPSTTTWDERVRTWASMLGVCAAPPYPSPCDPCSSEDNGQAQGTPLPTPPPDSAAWSGEEEGETRNQKQHHWGFDGLDCCTATVAVNNASAASAAGGTKLSGDKSSAAGASINCNAPATAASLTASPTVDGAATAGPSPSASTVKRKPGGTGKRVGSFARGFLLGLGGGVGSGGGGGGCSRSKSHEGKQDNVNSKPSSGLPTTSTVAETAPVSTLPSCKGGPPGLIVNGGSDDDNDAAALPSTPVVTSTPGATVAGHVTERMRWVKGALPSPGDSDSDGYGSDGSHDNGVQPVGDINAINAINANESEGGEEGGWPCPPTAVAVASADDEGMEWLETGGGNNATKTNGGKKATGGGGGGGASSKKKRKSKGRGKGGSGGGGGGKATKKLSSSASSSAVPDKNKTARTAAARFASQGGYQEAAVTGAGAGAGAKASLAKGRKNKKMGVSFGHVNLLEFTRDVGGCGVPSDGSWPLSLGLPFRQSVVDVDGYEASKAEILEQRTAELSRKQRHLSTGETRQFDYRPVGEKNPLFDRLGEQDRSKKLLDYACFQKADLEEAFRDKDEDDEGSKHADESQSHNRSHNDNDNDGSGGKRTSGLHAYTYKVSHADFVDKSREASAGLAVLRDSRKNNQGCSCSYVRPDKLNLAKLRGELCKRDLKASGSKKDLVKVLQEAMRQEEEQNGGKPVKLCRGEDCECFRNGVACHADLCNCCKGPSIGEKEAHHGGNCGNPEGVYAYKSSVVRAHRTPYVTSKVVPGRERGGGRCRSDSNCSDHH